MDLLALVQAEFTRSNADRRHPFRYFYLATFGVYPEVRMVVKRDFHRDWSVLFFTDSRTPKVEQLKNDDRISALFYHPKKLLQVRMKGRAVLIDEEHEDYERYFNQVKESPTLSDYMTVKAPGSELPGSSKIEYGEAIHFLAVKIQPEYLDVLQLGKEQHTRMAYTLRHGEWAAAVLVP